MEEHRPLAGIRVVEACGWNGALAGRLLADGGAEVVRLAPPDGDLLATEPPFFAGTGISIQETWYHAGKTIVTLSLDDEAGREALAGLLSGADILIDDWLPDRAPLGRDRIRTLQPDLVRVTVTPFGADGPLAAYRVNDLVQNAMSGSASVTGGADTPPLSGYGNQSYHTVGIFAAVAALAGLQAARAGGRGVDVDLSAYEALTSCTEQVLMQWFFPEFPSFAAPVARRQGSLHWSGAYAVYPTRTWDLMVTAALRFQDMLLPWLLDEESAGDLADRELYPDLMAILSNLPYVMEVIRKFVGAREADAVFHEAQRRHQSWGPAWDLETAVRSPQVAARTYLQRLEVPGVGSTVLPTGFFRADDRIRVPAPPRRSAVHEIAWSARVPRSSPPAPARESSPEQPLAGVRVLDFTHVLAGPYGTRVLADLGADVIKVSSAIRSGGSNGPGHPYYLMWNRNKRSVSLNMGTERGREIARDLAGHCDVIVENFSAGVIGRWGLDRRSLAVRHPAVSVVSMGGLGQDGPWKDYVTFAPTIHAMVGLTHLTSFPDAREPLGYGFSLTDHLGGLLAAYASLEALEHARVTGEGLAIDLSQYELGLGLMAPAIIEHLSSGTNPGPCGNRHPFGAWAPHGIYRASGTDRWVAIAARGDGEWRALCRAMEQPGLADDPRFATHEARLAAAEALDAVIEAWTEGMDRYEVVARCQAAGVSAGPVQDAPDLVGCAQHLHRGFFRTLARPGGGEHGADSFPALFNAMRPSAGEGVRDLGADTFDVLHELLGLGDSEIADLVADGTLS